jgi:hypothetical protein
MSKGHYDTNDNAITIGKMSFPYNKKLPIKESWFVNAVELLSKVEVDFLLELHQNKVKITYNETVDKYGFHHVWTFKSNGIKEKISLTTMPF